jgi:hypothetical protein
MTVCLHEPPPAAWGGVHGDINLSLVPVACLFPGPLYSVHAYTSRCWLAKLYLHSEGIFPALPVVRAYQLTFLFVIRRHCIFSNEGGIPVLRKEPLPALFFLDYPPWVLVFLYLFLYICLSKLEIICYVLFLYWSICRSSYNVSYLNLPPLLLSFIPPLLISGTVSTGIIFAFTFLFFNSLRDWTYTNTTNNIYKSKCSKYLKRAKSMIRI